MNKVTRLANGRYVTRKLIESDPAELLRAKEEEVWQNQSPISDDDVPTEAQQTFDNRQ